MTTSSGPTPLLLDTHIWLRYINSSQLRQSGVETIDSALAHGQVFVSVISIWEIAMLVRAGRLALNTSVDGWVEKALSLPGLQLLPFTPRIAIESVNLPDPMHKDPADRILVASARVEQLTLMTRDRDILAFAKTIRLQYLQA